MSIVATKELLIASFAATSADRDVEIVFSFDTTGSMYCCLEEVKREIGTMVERLSRDIPGVRIGIIAHGDYCDDAVQSCLDVLDFSSDRTHIADFINNVKETGGGDAPECYEYALRKASGMSWSAACQNKALVMIGDDIPHPPSYTNLRLSWKEELQKLKSAGVKVYGVQALSNRHAKPFYQYAADATGGVYINFKDFTLITDMFLAICYREYGSEQLETYRQEVMKQGRMNSGLSSIFRALSNQIMETLSPSQNCYSSLNFAWWDTKYDTLSASPTYIFDSISNKFLKCVKHELSNTIVMQDMENRGTNPMSPYIDNRIEYTYEENDIESEEDTSLFSIDELQHPQNIKNNGECYDKESHVQLFDDEYKGEVTILKEKQKSTRKRKAAVDPVVLYAPAENEIACDTMDDSLQPPMSELCSNAAVLPTTVKTPFLSSISTFFATPSFFTRSLSGIRSSWSPSTSSITADACDYDSTNDSDTDTACKSSAHRRSPDSYMQPIRKSPRNHILSNPMHTSGILHHRKKYPVEGEKSKAPVGSIVAIRAAAGGFWLAKVRSYRSANRVVVRWFDNIQSQKDYYVRLRWSDVIHTEAIIKTGIVLEHIREIGVWKLITEKTDICDNL
jgi:hypothetical protein